MQLVHPNHLPVPVAISVAAHEPDPHPQLVVVGLAAPATDPAYGNLHDLEGLGAHLVDLVESRPSVLALTLVLSLCL